VILGGWRFLMSEVPLYSEEGAGLQPLGEASRPHAWSMCAASGFPTTSEFPTELPTHTSAPWGGAWGGDPRRETLRARHERRFSPVGFWALRAPTSPLERPVERPVERGSVERVPLGGARAAAAAPALLRHSPVEVVFL